MKNKPKAGEIFCSTGLTIVVLLQETDIYRTMIGEECKMWRVYVLRGGVSDDNDNLIGFPTWHSWKKLTHE